MSVPPPRRLLKSGSLNSRLAGALPPPPPPPLLSPPMDPRALLVSRIFWIRLESQLMASLTKLAMVERPLDAQEGRMLPAISDRMLPTSSMQAPMPSTR